MHPYSHEQNGIVERANQEVLRHLTSIFTDKELTEIPALRSTNYEYISKDR